jgi:WD40 repeat protein
LIFADEGKALVGTGTDGNVYVWDAATGRELRHISGPPAHYYPDGFHPAVVYVPKARLVVSASGDHAIHIWDFDTGNEIRALKGHSADVNYLALSPDGKTLASASYDGSARLWDINTGRELRTLFQNQAGPRGNPECVCFSPDGRTVMTSERNGPTRLWDVATGKEILQLKGKFWLNDAVFKSDGRTLITEDAWTIRYWSTATGEELRRFERHSDDGSRMARGNRLALSPDEKILASAGSDSKILLWNTETGKPINEQGHAAQVSSLAYSPDGRLLATGAHDGTVRIWDLRTGKQTRAFQPIEPRLDPIWLDRIEFSSLGKILVSESYAALFFSVWDPIAGKELYRRKGGLATFSPDGKLIASVDWHANAPDPTHRAAIRLYEAETGKLLWQMQGLNNQTRAIGFLPDGKTLASQDGRIIHCWDVASGKEIRQSEGPWWGTISPDGRMVAWPDPNWPAGDWIPGGLRELASGQKRFTFSTRSYIFLPPLAFSPDGRMLAAVDALSAGAIRLWELPSCKQIGRLDGNQGHVFSLAFAPDGKSLASGGWDTSVLIWDVTPYQGKSEQVKLESDKLQALWRDLESDAETAYRAFADLAKSPRQAVRLMEERLSPVAAVALDQKEIDRLLSDLDSDQFAVREKASAALEGMGKKVESALRKALAGVPSAEARHRIDALLKKIQPQTKELREIRAVEILEYIAAPGADASRLPAIDLLKKLAAGAPEARLTQEVKAALVRLERQQSLR